MNLHEYQAKSVLAKFGVPVPRGQVAQSVAEVMDAARAGGRGTLGRQDTLAALEAMSVDTLLLSRGFIHEHPDISDHAVGLAFVQGADVEEVSGAVAEVLDGEGAGIAARLRFHATRS